MKKITRAFSSLLQWCGLLWPIRSHIEIEQRMWRDMVEELGRRSLDGSRETGAFLLAPLEKDSRRVVSTVYFDDLDPDCLVGNIHIRSIGFSMLWELCDKKGLRVLADVHTHPGATVDQSLIDRENPMIARDGHLALIVPFYGTRPVEARDVGVHLYRGKLGWVSWFGSKAERALCIRNN